MSTEKGMNFDLLKAEKSMVASGLKALKTELVLLHAQPTKEAQIAEFYVMKRGIRPTQAPIPTSGVKVPYGYKRTLLAIALNVQRGKH